MEQLDQKTQKRIAELAKQQQKIAAEISKLKINALPLFATSLPKWTNTMFLWLMFKNT